MKNILLHFFFLLPFAAVSQSDNPTDDGKSYLSIQRNGFSYFLSPGSTGQYLTTNGTTVSFGNKPSYTSSEITYDNAISGLTATNAKAAIDETVAAIPDNIADLTISADVDLSSQKITNLSNGTASTDAVNKSQLDAANSFTTVAPSNGDTIVLTNTETLIVVDGTLADPATFYIDGSSLPSRSKVYIKYGNFSGNATFDRDDDNDPGNFVATGSTSGTTTLTYTGTGFSAWIKSGATWYEMY